MTKRTYKYLQIKKVLKMAGNLTGCIEFPHFGASYPDACCIDGYLWDLDMCETGENGETMLNGGGDDPCPVCMTKQYIQDMLDNEVSVGRIVGHMTFIFNRYGNFKKQ